MHYVQELFQGMTIRPFLDVLNLMMLPPDNLLPALSLLASFMIVCEFLRIALGTVMTHKPLAHVIICLLTFAFQALVLALVLIFGDRAHPGRGWINLGIVAGLYLVWYLAGQATTLVRKDSEGADLGFMAVGALITFPVGVVTAIVM